MEEIVNWVEKVTGNVKGDYDSYKSKRQIADGGFSKIYYVEKNGKKYAMKEPKFEIYEDEQYKSDSTNNPCKDMEKMFEKEMQIWAKLTDKIPDDVVCLKDCNVLPHPWMVMEWADRTYRDEMEVRNSTPNDIIGLLESLQHIHEADVVHRDIKPSNILMVNGRWKFSDFGLSKETNALSSNGSKGTTCYMAPEQIDDNGKTDKRTDIWQMGILLYSVIMDGRLPYNACNDYAIVAEIMSSGADISNAPDDYKPILKKALSKDKAHRYQSASEFLEELRNLVEKGIKPKPVNESVLTDKKEAVEPIDLLRVKRMKDDGESLLNLKRKRIDSRLLREAGFTLDEFIKASYRSSEILTVGFDAVELKDHGYTANLLRDNGYSVFELYDAGYSFHVMKIAGYSLDELRDAGYPLSDFKKDSVDPADLKKIGFNAFDMRLAGFSPQELRKCFDIDDYIAGGFSLSEIHEAGFTPNVLFKKGYNIIELTNAGYTLKEFCDSSFKVKQLMEVVFSTEDLRDAGYTAKDLKDAGYTAENLRDAGYTAKDLKCAGFTKSDVYYLYSNTELRLAGYL